MNEPHPYETRDHESFSSLKLADTCLNRYYNSYVRPDRPPKVNNQYNVFGKAVHAACERLKYDSEPNALYELFKKEEKRQKDKLPEGATYDDEYYDDAAKRIFDALPQFMRDTFGKYEVVCVEHEIKSKINEDDDKFFVGLADFLIKLENGRYVLIDWKTTKSGWSKYQKDDQKLKHQLILYRRFLCEDLAIDPKLVDASFIFLKNKTKRKPIEIFPIKISKNNAQVSSANRWATKMMKILKKIKFFHPPNLNNIRLCPWCPFVNDGETPKLEFKKYCRVIVKEKKD